MKTEIKIAAMRLFSEKGYEKTTMNDIAKAVGIKKPSIYAHFENKNQLLISILDEQYSKALSMFEKIIAENRNKKIDAILKSIFINTVKYFSAGPNLLFWKRAFIKCTSNLSEDNQDNVRKIIDKLGKETFLKVYRLNVQHQLIKREDFKLLFYYICQFILGFLDILPYIPPEELEARMEVSWDFFWNGIKILFDN